MKRRTVFAVAILLLSSGFSVGFALARPSDSKVAATTIPQAQRIFAEATDLIRNRYVDAGLSEDELWSSAIEGILDRLIQVEGKRVNDLLSPQELASLREGLAGQLHGIGAVVDKVADFVVVQEALPGGAAAAAGLKANDRILKVDGKSVALMDLPTVLGLIRGTDGTVTKLFVQRGTEEWNVSLTRGAIKVESVVGDPSGAGGLAYLRIRSFDAHTVAGVDALLAKMGEAPGLVLDLRGCPGGLLNVALEVADRFLAKGKRIVTLMGRDGVEVVHTAKEPATFSGKQLVVLTDKRTSSGAEILAAALSDHKLAMLVGGTTFGKGTAETILKLSNDWALKLTAARMFSPNGKTWQGRGLSPDFPMGPSAEATNSHRADRRYSATAKLDLERDDVLKAAVSLVRLVQRR